MVFSLIATNSATPDYLLKPKSMKKFLPILSITVLMAACNSTPENIAGTAAAPIVQPMQAPAPDTSGLAEYQAWKAQNELNSEQPVYETEHPRAAAPVAHHSKPRQVQRTTASQPALPAPVEASKPSAPVASSGSSVDTAATGGAATSESTGTAKAEEKKGWSKSAKGAVIGGVVGAGAGAVINKKNPVMGAVIGGVIGAGGGYVLGRKMDKKDGR